MPIAILIQSEFCSRLESIEKIIIQVDCKKFKIRNLLFFVPDEMNHVIQTSDCFGVK
jgi:hypothetical protein